MIRRIFTLVVLLSVIALAIMFDWFGARNFFDSSAKNSQKIVKDLSDRGDKLQDSFKK